MEKIRVYSKENCMPCKATVRQLGKAGLAFEVIMLEDNEEKRNDLIEQGFTQSPVVEYGEEKWSGFRPDRIKELTELAKEAAED